MGTQSLWVHEAIEALPPAFESALARAGVKVRRDLVVEPGASTVLLVPMEQAARFRMGSAGQATLLVLADFDRPAGPLALADAVVSPKASGEELLARLAEAQLRASARGAWSLPREGVQAPRSRLLLLRTHDAGDDEVERKLSERHDVQTAFFASRALESALFHAPHALVVSATTNPAERDLLLAGMAADAALQDMPVAVLLAEDAEGERVRALELGAAEVLCVGDRPAESFARIDRMLRVAARVSRLRHEAETDHLTGLLNRRAFVARASLEHARARRHGLPLSVMALDLDGLKQINDRMGHAAGDLLLVQLARLLTRQLRLIDLAARVGGDEFLLLLPHTDRAEAALLEQRLQAAGAQERNSIGEPLRFSLGSTTLEADESLESLIRRADVRLVEAKRQRHEAAEQANG